MKILIIEDEAPAYRRLEKILIEIDPEIQILEVLDSVEESVKWFQTNAVPDVALMDIQISDGISFQIFEKIEVKCPVIFTTAFDEYMMRAFKVNSIDYLLKPIKKEELEQALRKFKNLRNTFSADTNLTDILKQISRSEAKYKGRFLVKLGDKMLSIRSEDVVCFHSRHGVVHIVTKSGKTYLSDFTLDDLITQLDPAVFYRANRQFIIHADHIQAVHRYFKGKLLVELSGFTGEDIIVSSEKAAGFKEWLDQ